MEPVRRVVDGPAKYGLALILRDVAWIERKRLQFSLDRVEVHKNEIPTIGTPQYRDALEPINEAARMGRLQHNQLPPAGVAGGFKGCAARELLPERVPHSLRDGVSRWSAVTSLCPRVRAAELTLIRPWSSCLALVWIRLFGILDLCCGWPSNADILGD
jgi:hypothetical protein